MPFQPPLPTIRPPPAPGANHSRPAVSRESTSARRSLSRSPKPFQLFGLISACQSGWPGRTHSRSVRTNLTELLSASAGPLEPAPCALGLADQ